MSTADCKHEQFSLSYHVTRLLEDGPRILYLQICCATCSLPFEWLGIPPGFSYCRPSVNRDKLELRAPVVPRGKVNPEVPVYQQAEIGGVGT
jgi:hypothetical protein